MNKKNIKKASRSIKSKKEKTLDLELRESKDKYLRLYSEFENYRRRTSKEKVEMIDSANQDLLKDILPIADDFDRAINSIKKQKLIDYEGFNLIFQKLNNILEKYNLKKMGTKKGDNFDSELEKMVSPEDFSKQDLRNYTTFFRDDYSDEIDINPEKLKNSPRSTPVSRLNETLANRKLDVKFDNEVKNW